MALTWEQFLLQVPRLLQHLPKNMHMVRVVYRLGDAVACSGLQCIGVVWVVAHPHEGDIRWRLVIPNWAEIGPPQPVTAYALCSHIADDM